MNRLRTTRAAVAIHHERRRDPMSAKGQDRRLHHDEDTGRAMSSPPQMNVAIHMSELP